METRQPIIFCDITALFARMRQRMVIQNLSPRTIHGYLHIPERLVRYFNRHPADIGKDMIYKYLVYLKEEKRLDRNSMRITIAGIKYLYTHILNVPEIVDDILYPKFEKHFPVILSMNELRLIFDQTTNRKHRFMLKLIYSLGLRRGEAQNLELSDIDLMNRNICIRQGKVRKNRYLNLSPHLLSEMKSYTDELTPSKYLFLGRNMEQ